MTEKSNFRILVIDDNPAIHEDFIKILKVDKTSEFDSLKMEIFGKNALASVPTLPEFEIDVASQGQEGVKRIHKALQEGRPYSLAFVDIRMPPGWDGVQTIKHIWELDKNIQVVICTAYSDYSWEETVAALGKTDNLLILKKPFDNISIRQLACALTTKWQLAEESRNYTKMLMHEVSERTDSLEKSLSLVKSTFESSSDGILVVNTEGHIIDHNQKLIEMLELPVNVIQSKSEAKIWANLETRLEQADNFVDRLQNQYANSEEIGIDVIKFKNGKVLECYSQPHRLNNKVVGRILDFRDITKRAKLEEQLQYQATHDSLTGLPNRVKLMEKIRDAMQVCDERNEKIAILFLDFDRFKLVNDSLSHTAGDELLQSASQRLRSVINENDTLARLGGDEFVMVLTAANNPIDIADRVDKILKIFHEPFTIMDRSVTLTASIGISVYPSDGKSIDIMLRNADSAMYRAKALKGNNYQFYTPEMNTQSLAEFDQEMELRQALANNEFFLCYQPQLDLVDEKLVAVEALLRWRHPTKGVLLPIDFIPVAEDSGLILPISEWVLRTACKQNADWQKAGFPPIRVAVNVTAQQFKQQDLMRLVKDVLAETKLKPEYLELELTENVLLSSPDVIKTVSDLKTLNIQVAIDDFGTGYSSLSYLQKIPLDRLKIDRSFIQHIKSPTDDEVIIRAVISMAKNLKLEVLAEGVETADQLDFLRKNDCGDVQGFYFSKPLTPEDLEPLLKDPNHIKNIHTLMVNSKED